jgi:GH15 family glucan-1,4-alpha-glucosidase
MNSHIEDYALIGDCQTAALVNRHGSIDWLCWPHFASPACFAALLGTEENGHWSIAPKDPASASCRYLDHTLVLESCFETREGRVALFDFMPIRGRNSCLVRLVRGLHGAVPMKMELVLRFNYGRSVPWVTRLEDGALRAIAGPDMAVLYSTTSTHGENLKTVSEFTIHEGETVAFALAYGGARQICEMKSCGRLLSL